MLLSARGFSVTLLEKQRTVGGRSSSLVLGGYSFDLGSTILMMRFVLEEMFALAGRRLDDYVRLVPLDPMYRLVFGDRGLDVYADPERMVQELRRFAPGSEDGLPRFLEHEHARLEQLYPLMQKSWLGLGSLLAPSVVKSLPWVGIGRSLHATAGDYFEDEDLKLGFSFQSAYLGMSPWKCPGGFGMIPYVEHGWGVDYARGGVHKVCAAMEQVARELSATIRTSAEVASVVVEDGRAVGVELTGGELVPADAVVVDADAVAALTRLLDEDVSLRFRKARLERLKESCSTFMLYLGLDTELPLRHHTFFFADDYKEEMERVFGRGELSDDLSVYVCSPVVTDPSMAPPGHSALYLLALAPNTRSGIDWEAEAPRMRARILETLARRTGVDVTPHIRVEHQVSPRDWESSFSISHGAVFGPTHDVDQLLAFRLPHRLPDPDNVFLTGAGTSPGSGIPTILESARITTRLLCEEHGIPFPESQPLPEPTTWVRERGAVEAS
jgi:phytoene desaturase